MLLVTFEVLLVVVAPLQILYLRGPWPLRTAVPSLVLVPVLWYLAYAPLHELSHVLGTWAAGASVTSVKAIPRFWTGEVATAWITATGLDAPWQQALMLIAPYVLDGVSAVIGLAFLRRSLSPKPFVVGMAFMLLCLRPAFDLVCETVAFTRGFRGDLYHLGLIVGTPAVGTLLLILMTVAAVSIVAVLRRFRATVALTAVGDAG